jgi:uncharacterized protein involved in response to NO
LPFAVRNVGGRLLEETTGGEHVGRNSTIDIGSWRGPAVLGAGFRPIFLLGGLWAAIAILVWFAAFAGRIVAPTAFAPTAWHAHEMLYGFVEAAVAGPFC